MSVPNKGVTLYFKAATVSKRGGHHVARVVLDAHIRDWDLWEETEVALRELDLYAHEDIKTQVIAAMREEKREREQVTRAVENITAKELAILRVELEMAKEETVEEKRKRGAEIRSCLYLKARVGELQRQLLNYKNGDCK